VAILIDPNGKFIQEDKLFPDHKVSNIWCPKTQDALYILSQPDFDTPGHIIIHTGTINLREGQERTTERASEWFPQLPHHHLHSTAPQRLSSL
jgi:hypothetical protein